MLDVLIVGAGPTGLMLAAELQRRGIRFGIIDREPERPQTSRALVVHARSLELFQKLGIADPLVARGRTAVHMSAYIEGRKAVDADFGDIGVDDAPYPFILFISQLETENALEGLLVAHGVEVERRVELIGFEQDADGVTAHLRRNGVEEEVRAAFLAGCDGAHSAVRHVGGFAFEGARYPQDFILADVHIDWDQPADDFMLFLAGHNLLALFPLQPRGLIRLIGSRGDAIDTDDEPTLADFEALFAKCAPFRARLHDVEWITRFRLHHRGADRYRSGRVFLAGDAAHIHSPAGGQGMNTGIQDAENLAWKLALAARGLGGERLLDSYNAERRPVGQRLLRFTDRLFAFATSTLPGVATIRNLVMPLFGPWVMRNRNRRRRAFHFISQLGIRYDGSPIVGKGAGGRAPDAPVGSSSIFEMTRGPEHHLLVFAESAPPDIPPHLRVIRIGRDATIARERYGVKGEACVLIRPDGYIGFRSDGGDPTPALDFLRSVIPSQRPGA